MWSEPYEDDWGEQDDACDHEDYEVDILDGRCWCDRCGHRWHATNEQIEAQIEHEAAYHEHMERENRRQWWRDLWWRIRSIFPQRRGPQIASDDEIPF